MKVAPITPYVQQPVNHYFHQSRQRRFGATLVALTRYAVAMFCRKTFKFLCWKEGKCWKRAGIICVMLNHRHFLRRKIPGWLKCQQWILQTNIAEKNGLVILVHVADDHGGYGRNVTAVARRLTGTGWSWCYSSSFSMPWLFWTTACNIPKGCLALLCSKLRWHNVARSTHWYPMTCTSN